MPDAASAAAVITPAATAVADPAAVVATGTVVQPVAETKAVTPVATVKTVAPVADSKPAEITLKLPDGAAIDQKHLDALAIYAKEHGFSQKQADALVARDNALVAGGRQAQAKQIEDAQTKWEADALADVAIASGDTAKLTAFVEVAQKPLAKFATPEFRAFLETSKLGSHPEALKFLNAIGRAMGEDNPLSTSATAKATRPKTLAEVLYP